MIKLAELLIFAYLCMQHPLYSVKEAPCDSIMGVWGAQYRASKDKGLIDKNMQGEYYRFLRNGEKIFVLNWRGIDMICYSFHKATNRGNNCELTNSIQPGQEATQFIVRLGNDKRKILRFIDPDFDFFPQNPKVDFVPIPDGHTIAPLPLFDEATLKELCIGY